MLIGADASHHGDRCMCVTIHHCFFDGTRQRHPRVRFAKVHLYNNYTRNWGLHAVCASVESQIYSQCNIYEAGQKRVAFKYLTEKAGDKEEACTGCIISEGDLFMNGTQQGLPETTATSGSFHPIQHYQTWTVQPATMWLKHILQHCSGWQAFANPWQAFAYPSGKRAASSSRKEPEKEKQNEDKYAKFLRHMEQFNIAYEKIIAEHRKLMQKKWSFVGKEKKGRNGSKRGRISTISMGVLKFIL